MFSKNMFYILFDVKYEIVKVRFIDLSNSFETNIMKLIDTPIAFTC